MNADDPDEGLRTFAQFGGDDREMIARQSTVDAQSERIRDLVTEVDRLTKALAGNRCSFCVDGPCEHPCEAAKWRELQEENARLKRGLHDMQAAMRKLADDALTVAHEGYRADAIARREG